MSASVCPAVTLCTTGAWAGCFAEATTVAFPEDPFPFDRLATVVTRTPRAAAFRADPDDDRLDAIRTTRALRTIGRADASCVSSGSTPASAIATWCDDDPADAGTRRT